MLSTKITKTANNAKITQEMQKPNDAPPRLSKQRADEERNLQKLCAPTTSSHQELRHLWAPRQTIAQPKATANEKDSTDPAKAAGDPDCGSDYGSDRENCF